MFQTLLNKLTHIGLTFLVFTYIIFEEFVWETIAKPIYEFIHSLKILQKTEVLIHKLHRIVLLIIFLILFIQVELLGFAAVALLAKGQVYTGVLLYIGKIPIGAFTFWLFRISQDKLMTFGWFKAIYDFVMKIIDKIKASETYQKIKTQAKTIRAFTKERITIFKETYLSKDSSIKEKVKNIYTNTKKAFKR